MIFGTATFLSVLSWAIPSFWWRGASAILFPSSCELMPICTPNKQQELVSKLEAIGSPTSNIDDSDLMSLG